PLACFPTRRSSDLADELALERYPTRSQQAAGLDEVGVPLDLVHRADAQDGERGVAPLPGFARLEHAGIHTAALDEYVFVRRILAVAQNELPVVVRDAHHERRLFHL